ncbi:hypothetical protein PSEEN2245 [Pseudomonas entomophila L48]|uniref:Uncharacterized protein n=1 Tax=Pseudomonas entomophila (strain L48) TaxID=384676 RepID=Q1IBA5_PSEE4|nr:hypothetical protein PSEEN2245 [Pseudomonas entomophila L48]
MAGQDVSDSFEACLCETRQLSAFIPHGKCTKRRAVPQAFLMGIGDPGDPAGEANRYARSFTPRLRWVAVHCFWNIFTVRPTRPFLPRNWRA